MIMNEILLQYKISELRDLLYGMPKNYVIAILLAAALEEIVAYHGLSHREAAEFLVKQIEQTNKETWNVHDES